MDWNEPWSSSLPNFLGHERHGAEALVTLGKNGKAGNSSQGPSAKRGLGAERATSSKRG